MSSFRRLLDAAKGKMKDRHDHNHHHHHHPPPIPPRPLHNMPRKVFAHYMMGLTDAQLPSQWITEIALAQAAGIDGFALNIGPSDPWTRTQLQAAYQAASSSPPFTLFLSFDMAAGIWDVSQVVSLINEFKDFPAQMRVDGRPLVSTFEGPSWADNWAAVRAQVPGGICFMPDWSSLGAWGVGQKLDVVDGAFSWGAWPQAGQTRMHTGEDIAYKNALRGKRYMMGVSPHFYTNLPQWSKNWYSSSESLWYDRWQQVLEIMPDFVQIITWNDYGESSYICDPFRPQQVVPGADKYVNDFSHKAFRAVLPYFIAAYKAGDPRLPLPAEQEETAIAWYRTHPVGCGHDGGTVWGQGGGASAAHGARDIVSIITLTRGTTAVTLEIGGQGQTFEVHGDHPLFYLQVPFDGRQGPVTIGMNGKCVTGPEIVNDCPPCGHVLFNVAAIQLRG